MRLIPPFLLAILLLAGCFQTHTVIFLNADGSGTIEETVLLASYAVNMMAAFGSADSTQTFGLIDDEKLTARADSLGEGVTFEGVEPLTEGGYEGYVATYAFTDINQIRLRDNSDALQLGDDNEKNEQGRGMDGIGLDNVIFSYEPGVLEIYIPREDGPETVIHPDNLAAETEKIRQQMQEQGGLMRALLGDARMSASIVFPGTITETNASYVDSTTVTLVDLLIGPMLDLMDENPELAARLQLAQSESQRQALLAEMAELGDFRYEVNNTVVVRFE